MERVAGVSHVQTGVEIQPTSLRSPAPYRLGLKGACDLTIDGRLLNCNFSP